MTMNLDGMTLTELQSLKKDVDAAIKTFEKRKRKEALIAAQKAAQEHGFSLEEIYSEKTVSKGVPKYANPSDPSQTWTGRGRQPQWVKDAFASGKSLDEMAI